MLAIGPALAEAAAAGMARVNTWLLKIVIVQRCHHPISGDLYLLVAFQLLEYQWSECELIHKQASSDPIRRF